MKKRAEAEKAKTQETAKVDVVDVIVLLAENGDIEAARNAFTAATKAELWEEVKTVVEEFNLQGENYKFNTMKKEDMTELLISVYTPKKVEKPKAEKKSKVPEPKAEEAPKEVKPKTDKPADGFIEVVSEEVTEVLRSKAEDMLRSIIPVHAEWKAGKSFEECSETLKAIFEAQQFENVTKVYTVKNPFGIRFIISGAELTACVWKEGSTYKFSMYNKEGRVARF